jgi:Protein of unknown function (DUF1173)
MRNVIIDFPEIGRYSREWIEHHDTAAQEILARCKGKTPLCLCKQGGVPMYIARRHTYYLARMPLSGQRHAADCPSFEPDPNSCGRGIYSKTALSDNHDGDLLVKLDVPFLIRAGGGNPNENGLIMPSGMARETRDQLKLTGLMHLLWDRAGFNAWVPNMAGRRHYKQVQYYVSEAAESIRLRRHALAKHFYFPEPFVASEALAIESRRQALFNKLSRSVGGSPQRILMCAKIRSITLLDQGAELQFGHLPGSLVVKLDEHTLSTLKKHSSFAYVDWPNIHPSMNVFVLATIYRSKSTNWVSDQLTALVTTQQFIPLFNLTEALMVEKLINERRSFYKPMPYDADPRRYANFLLTDIGEDALPVEIFYLSEEAEAPRTARIVQYQENQRPYYQWDSAKETSPPALPGIGELTEMPAQTKGSANSLPAASDGMDDRQLHSHQVVQH